VRMMVGGGVTFVFIWVKAVPKTEFVFTSDFCSCLAVFFLVNINVYILCYVHYLTFSCRLYFFHNIFYSSVSVDVV
jgi:hypothetical protein